MLFMVVDRVTVTASNTAITASVAGLKFHEVNESNVTKKAVTYAFENIRTMKFLRPISNRQHYRQRGK